MNYANARAVQAAYEKGFEAGTREAGNYKALSDTFEAELKASKQEIERLRSALNRVLPAMDVLKELAISTGVLDHLPGLPSIIEDAKKTLESSNG